MLARDWLNTYYLEDTGLFRVSLGGFFRFLSIGPHEFCPRKNVTLHGLGELIVSCPGREPDFGIQRKEPDIIAVSPRRGTRAHVADLTTIISAMYASSGNVVILGNVGVKVTFLCRDVVKNPMREPACSGRVRIVNNQSKRLGLSRSFLPGKFRGDIVAFTSEANRDCASSTEVRTR